MQIVMLNLSPSIALPHKKKFNNFVCVKALTEG